MARTASKIIKSALRKVGVLTKSEAPSADEASDALEALNDLLGSLSNDGLLIYSRTLESFPLSSGVSDYTIGSGGDFDTDRPIRIVSAYVRSGSIDYPLKNITDVAYSKISYKDIGSLPCYINYDNAHPLSTIKLYPQPSSGYTLYVLSEKPLASFTLNQEVDLPSGWFRYLTNQLAIEVASEYGLQIPQEVAMIARDSLGAITRGSARVRTMDANKTSVGIRNIYTGWLN